MTIIGVFMCAFVYFQTTASLEMLHPAIPAVLCGVVSVGIIVTTFLLCRHLKKRRHQMCIPNCGYDAIGDCKPPSLMSVSSTSQV